MIVYEVNLEVRAEIASEYRAWLAEHVERMLALPGFVGAEVLERLDPPPPEGKRVFVAHYRLIDERAMQSYLAEHAPRMRDEGARRFGDQFTATRRILMTSSSHTAKQA